MTTTMPAKSITLDQGLAKLSQELSAALAQTPNGGVLSDSQYQAANFAAGLLAGVPAVASAAPATQSKVKAVAPLAITDASLLQDKNWLSEAFSIVQTTAPLIINALSKDFKDTGGVVREALQGVQPGRNQDKDWVNFVVDMVTTLTPMVAQAITGQKDFRTTDDIPTITVPPQASDKSWFSDAINAVQKIAPVALPVVMSLI